MGYRFQAPASASSKWCDVGKPLGADQNDNLFLGKCTAKITINKKNWRQSSVRGRSLGTNTIQEELTEEEQIMEFKAALISSWPAFG